ncbi:MAG: protein-methionine-sulfoxide reductase catalytic subunit MsrP [Alphaproteobacteria bacterium]|nr:protein-methionine-sulfoxide reductase catalytic subunit MsrP [Alphaproteobacteria bacterium]
MLIKRTRGWEIPERDATPEWAYSRRHVLAAGAGLAASSLVSPLDAAAQTPADPNAALYPAMRNMRYRVDRDITEEKIATTYNNYYEFGTSKTIWQAAQKLPLRPWQVKIEGLVESPRTVDFDDIMKAMKLEERVYRFRCVEAWAMTVPWTGFPLASFVEWCKPLSGAKYLQMETFSNPAVASGQRASWYPWPYTEGLAIDEAMNELAFIATGIYGKPVPAQQGAPLRLITPWKYGFKQAKALVRFVFTDKRPSTFWQTLGEREYGFWANINPKVPHPRWSQASEELIGAGGKRVPTQIFNGYGDFVASLYDNRQNERLWA